MQTAECYEAEPRPSPPSGDWWYSTDAADEALEPMPDRDQLTSEIRALRMMWRLPTAPDGAPWQPATAEEEEQALRMWALAGVVAKRGTKKYGPLLALMDADVHRCLAEHLAELRRMDEQSGIPFATREVA